MTDAGEDSTSKINQIADALDAYGEGGHSNAEDARETAIGLRFYADEPDVNRHALRELLTKAVDTFALADGRIRWVPEFIRLTASAKQALG
ncbi:hypothetical protein [Rhodococcus sp. (in: high G+C Gram-positive bacteria)]|uniref:hypothetical protein n=1 Tax=Rhodococcus sp. TaxID=1831 RepID=UPI00257E8D86|nr:hypothetical protein [Rhodococcus sp. (in: high G+C Gram-positive bacteria)]MBQ7805961.1 hypothetical protein [Rhodococcus sp. (in: high G+C Gram-positive bacteria)]